MQSAVESSHRLRSDFVSIVIPARNEAHRIGPVIERYARYFGNRCELIVVLNGCTDDTETVVSRVRAAFPNLVRIVTLTQAAGKGSAVHEGFRQARADVIGFTDADGSTTPEEFDRLLQQMNGYEGIIGSRWMRGAHVYNRSSLLRKVASYGFVSITKILFGLPYHDTQCGAKWFTRAAIQKMLPELRIATMAFDVELLVIARLLGFTVKEVPTTWTDSSSSTMLGSPIRLIRTSWGMLRELLRLFRRVRHYRHI